MFYSFAGIVLAITLCVMMVACIMFGQIIGKKKPAKSGLNITEGAVFALMGLLVAFTFAGSNQRFDQRRATIINESNAISTAYLRLDILQLNDRLLLKKDFLLYVTSRLAIYEAIPDFNKIATELHASKEVQTKLWHDAVNASRNAGTPMAAMLILPSINLMFDIANTRISYTDLHPHFLVFFLLIMVTLASSFLAGYGIAGREAWSSLHIIAYAIITTLTIYIIIDIEYPRFGMIQESSFDKYLIELKNNLSS